MKEGKAPYEKLLGEMVMDAFSRNRITKRFRVKLEEQISYNGKGAQYQHHLASTIYAIRGGLSEQPLSPRLEDYWYNEDEEPLAQKFLEGTVKYLEKNYRITLFKINNTSISEPLISGGEKGKYTGEFFIIQI